MSNIWTNIRELKKVLYIDDRHFSIKMDLLQVFAAATLCVCSEVYVYIGLVTCYISCREYALGMPILLLLLLLFSYSELKYACVKRHPRTRRNNIHEYACVGDRVWIQLLRLMGLQCGVDDIASLTFVGADAHALDHHRMVDRISNIMGIGMSGKDVKQQG